MNKYKEYKERILKANTAFELLDLGEIIYPTGVNHDEEILPEMNLRLQGMLSLRSEQILQEKRKEK